MHLGKLSTLFLLLASLVLVPSLEAQATSQPTSQPTSRPAQAKGVVPENQAPEVPREQRLKGLMDRLAKLKQEKASFEKVLKSGGMTKQAVRRIKYRNLRDVRETPTNMPSLPSKKLARLMGDAEKAKLEDDVIMIVEGLPITQKQFDGVYNYLRSYPRQETDEQIKTMVISTFVEVKAAEAAFPKTAKEAHAKITRIREMLTKGGDFAALAKAHSQDYETGRNGGEVGFIGRNQAGPLFAKEAFGLAPGKISSIVQTKRGFHLLQVLGKKKADSSDKDKSRVRHIMVMYNEPEAKVLAVQRKVKTAMVDVAFRTRELKKHAPKHLTQ